MRVLMILPSLTEAKSPFFRPIKYSLFPPLGLATLAAYCPADWDVRIVDEHVEPDLDLSQPPCEVPDLVVIQVYITNAYRAYALADYYRAAGSHVALGGLHVTSLPNEAAAHADTVFLGPGEQTFPAFLHDFAKGVAKRCYDSADFPRSIKEVPPIRRDLIRRELYFVPNSIVVTRGCPHHCRFCYKDAFFAGGRGFYTQGVDGALAEIERLPGRHLYFLDDHLLGHERFARELFAGMRGMKRLFQGAATVDSILRTDLIEHAAAAGLRSLFVGFETLSSSNLRQSQKVQNLDRDYAAAVQRLHDNGIMINGSFVFGLDDDSPDVFDRTVEWAVQNGLTTATFHIATPYPGTKFYDEMQQQGRILHRRWNRYDTRQVVFQPRGMTTKQLKAGYWRAYRDFYSYRNIVAASRTHDSLTHAAKHFAYAVGWKKLEPMWNALIRSKQLALTRPLLNAVLASLRRNRNTSYANTASAASVGYSPESIALPIHPQMRR